MNVLMIVLDSVAFANYQLAKTPNFTAALGHPEARQACGAATDIVFAALAGAKLPGPEIMSVPGTLINGDTPGAVLKKSGSSHGSSVAEILRKHHGYKTVLLGAAPPLFFQRGLRFGWDVYEMIEWAEDQCDRLGEVLSPDVATPWFAIMNWFEGHQPYTNKAGEGPDKPEYYKWWKAQDQRGKVGKHKRDFLDKMRELRRAQVQQVEHMDKVFGERVVPWLARCVEPVQLHVFADHGQAFGEGQHHGHDLNLACILTVPYMSKLVMPKEPSNEPISNVDVRPEDEP